MTSCHRDVSQVQFFFVWMSLTQVTLPKEETGWLLKIHFTKVVCSWDICQQDLVFLHMYVSEVLSAISLGCFLPAGLSCLCLMGTILIGLWYLKITYLLLIGPPLTKGKASTWLSVLSTCSLSSSQYSVYLIIQMDCVRSFILLTQIESECVSMFCVRTAWVYTLRHYCPSHTVSCHGRMNTVDTFLFHAVSSGAQWS